MEDIVGPEKTLITATLVYPVRDVVSGDKIVSEVMLAKKLQKIGVGHLNGWGGGVNPGESLRTCAVREFLEETGGARVRPMDLKKVGIAHFRNCKTDGTKFTCTVHVYTVTDWEGKIVATKEMGEPAWYPISIVETLDLMPADKFWLPRMLLGEKGVVRAEYSPRQEKLIGEVTFSKVHFGDRE